MKRHQIIGAAIVIILVLLMALQADAQSSDGIPLSICTNHADQWVKLEMRVSQQLSNEISSQTLTEQHQFNNFLAMRGQPFIFWGYNAQGLPTFYRNLKFPQMRTSDMLPMFEVLASNAQGNVVDRYEIWYNRVARVNVIMQTTTRRGETYYDAVVTNGFACVWIMPSLSNGV